MKDMNQQPKESMTIDQRIELFHQTYQPKSGFGFFVSNTELLKQLIHETHHLFQELKTTLSINEKLTDETLKLQQQLVSESEENRRVRKIIAQYEYESYEREALKHQPDPKDQEIQNLNHHIQILICELDQMKVLVQQQRSEGKHLAQVLQDKEERINRLTDKLTRVHAAKHRLKSRQCSNSEMPLQ